MGLAGQHGPLAAASAGRFLTPSPLPGPLLFAEPLRRRMRVRLDELWIADIEDVVLLHEPGRYPADGGGRRYRARAAIRRDPLCRRAFKLRSIRPITDDTNGRRTR
jgi:hypothetical protein